MATEFFFAKNVPKPRGAYSHGSVANGFLYTCGMGPIDPVTEKIIEGDITVQTRQVFKNLQAILAEKNADFSQVIKVTTHLQDVHKDFAAYDAVCREFLTEPFPVRTTVGSELMNILVEIDLVVAL